MYAIKGNKEVKIVDIQKDGYLEDGYTILDDNFKIVERPISATISYSEHEKVVAEKDKKIKELEKKIAELTKSAK